MSEAKLRVWEHDGVIFASSRSWDSALIDALLEMGRASSAGLEAVQRLPGGLLVARWQTGMLCSQAPGLVAGQRVVHALNGYPPPVRYYEYIATPEWLKRSRSVKKSQGWRCADCGRSTSQLQANHICYSRLGSELPSDLNAVCEACHRRRHGLG